MHIYVYGACKKLKHYEVFCDFKNKLHTLLKVHTIQQVLLFTCIRVNCSNNSIMYLFFSSTLKSLDLLLHFLLMKMEALQEGKFTSPGFRKCRSQSQQGCNSIYPRIFQIESWSNFQIYKRETTSNKMNFKWIILRVSKNITVKIFSKMIRVISEALILQTSSELSTRFLLRVSEMGLDPHSCFPGLCSLQFFLVQNC